MSTNVRRLALDISPSVWAYILFLFCALVLEDGLWFRHSEGIIPLLPGFLMFITAAFTAQKVPFWRTLPVTRIQIDGARWWQSVAGSALILCTACFGSALVMNALGLRRAAWPDIAMLALAQSSICALIVGVITVAFPVAAKGLGRWSAVLLIPLMLGIFRINQPHYGQADMHDLLLAVDAIGLATAAALYMLAGRWPAPLTTALWAVPPKDRTPLELATSKRSSLRGWPILVWGNAPIFLILFTSEAWIPLTVKWLLPDVHLSMLGWMTCLLALQVAVSGIATAMRTLRALPLSGGQLTCRLILFVLLVQVISLVIFRAVLQLAGEQALSPAIFLIPLAYSLIYLPFGLRFGLRILQFGLALSIIFIIPVQLLSWSSDATPWIVVGSLAVMVVGSAWTYWEITRGHHAYRMRPLVPTRWRNFK